MEPQEAIYTVIITQLLIKVNTSDIKIHRHVLSDLVLADRRAAVPAPWGAAKSVQFLQFSAQHRNAQRNWLMLKLNTDQPGLYGLGDASPMQNDEQVKALIAGWIERYLKGRDPLDSEVLWTTRYHGPQARGGRLPGHHRPLWAGHRPVGHQGQAARRTRLQAAGRGAPQAHPRLRQRLVHQPRHTGAERTRGQGGGRLGLYRAQV